MNLPSHSQARHSAGILRNIVDPWKQQLDIAVSDTNTPKENGVGHKKKKKNEEGKF